MSSKTSIAQLLQQAEKAHKQGKLSSAMELYNTILAEVPLNAEDVTTKQARLTALESKGDIYSWQGEQEKSLKSYHQYYLEAGNSNQAVQALVRIAEQQGNMGLYQEALATNHEAMTLAEALNDTVGRAQVHDKLGIALAYLGRLEEALVHLNKSLSLFRQLDEPKEQAEIWNHIGVTNSYLGMLDEAISAYEKGLAFREVLDLRQITKLLLNLGEVYQTLFDMEQAIAYHSEALPIAQQLQNIGLIGDIERNLGIEKIYLDQHDEGMKHLYHALKLAEDAKETDFLMQTLYSVAFAEITNKRLDEASAHAQQLKKLADKHQAVAHQAGVGYLMGLIAHQQGDKVAAEGHWQQAIFLAHETGKRDLLWQVHARLAESADSPTLAQIHHQIAADVIRQIAYPLQDEALKKKFLQAETIRATLDSAA